MFSPELEKRLRGLFISPTFAEGLVEQRISSQRQAQAEKSGEPPFNDVRKRAIVRRWPRDPEGPVLRETPPGKTAGNEQPLWGATVLDFFYTSRAGKIPNAIVYTTGSKLLKWVKETQELDYAKDEISWAEDEPDPRQILPYDMATLIRDRDHIHGTQEWVNSGDILENGQLSAKRYPIFQNCLPFALLPSKLIVHDPDDTLRVEDEACRPSEERNNPRVYKLSLAPETREEIEKERNQALKEHVENSKLGKRGTVYTPLSEELKTRNVKEGPVIEATMASCPPPPTPNVETLEAHIYINKDDKIGSGNHSHVYQATWEIPRELLIAPYLCSRCISDAFLKKLKEEAPDAKVDETKDVESQIETLLFNLAEKHGRKGKITREEATMPSRNIEVVNGRTGESRRISVNKGQVIYRLAYEGTIREVPADVKWNTPAEFCCHEQHRNNAPKTWKVSVAAKLSRRYDEHLEREASNYQKFPRHFFEHWSGYNLIRPLHDPTPALAVVPQFYGYYVPEDAREGEDSQYLSPILLLEHCGTPVDVAELDLDDSNECMALLLRMHCEGWLHNSFYPRNVLMQHGDIADWPLFRSAEDRRFRIIDFGRSTYHSETDKKFPMQRSKEEASCREIFGILPGPAHRQTRCTDSAQQSSA